jgi:hypothetical protein
MGQVGSRERRLVVVGGCGQVVWLHGVVKDCRQLLLLLLCCC